MDRENRAKQFQPFDALRGLTEALRQREKIPVQRKEVSEEYGEELNRLLHQVRRQDTVTVVYFFGDGYRELTGTVTAIEESAGFFRILDEKVPFADIYELSRHETDPGE